MSLANFIKRLQDIMRNDSGVSGDAQRLEQIVWLLFLKIFDHREKANAWEDDYEDIIPEGFRWRDWASCEDKSSAEKMVGDELLDFVNNKLFPVLRGEVVNGCPVFDNNSEGGKLVRTMMRDSNNYMKSGIILRQVIDMLADVDLDDSDERHQFNDMYETLLKSLQSAGNSGEFYTPRVVTEFIVDKVNPKVGEIVGDFACGTGGFLIDSARHMEKSLNSGDVEGYKKLYESLRGKEWKPLPYMLCVTNLLLRGAENPHIEVGDSLSQPIMEFTEADKVDCILMNPPYGGVALPEDKCNFPTELQSGETADLFVAMIIERLKDNGRAAIILPDGFLFGTEGAKYNIKRKLMNECNLHTIVRLPAGCFAPYTSITTNILFFDKGTKTEETWFYRVNLPEGLRAFTKTKSFKSEHLNDLNNWWNNRVEIQEDNNYQAKKFTFAELEEKKFNLDQCGYNVAEKVVLPLSEAITNFENVKREYIEELDKLSELLKPYADIL